jgi:hypothetical protein
LSANKLVITKHTRSRRTRKAFAARFHSAGPLHCRTGSSKITEEFATEIIVTFYVPSDTVLFPKASEQAGGQMKEQLGMCAPKDLWVSTTVAPQAPTIFLWLL